MPPPTQGDSTGPASASTPKKRRRRPTTGVAQAKRKAWGTFWGPQLAAIARKVEEGRRMSSNPYGIGTSQASTSLNAIEDAVQEIQTALQKALTAINSHRAHVSQLEQQSQTQGGSPS